MSDLTANLASLNSELDAIENKIGPLVGPAGSKSIAECLLTLSTQLVGWVAGDGTTEWKNGATTNYVNRLLQAPLHAIGGDSNDWGTALSQAKKELFGSGSSPSPLTGGLDLLANPILMALTAQSAVVNQAIDQIVDGFSGSGDSSQDRAQAQFQSQLRGLFANNGADLASTLAALIVYAAGSILPRIDRERQILRDMRATLRAARDQAVALPPSMIPGVPNSLAIQLLCEAEGFLAVTKRDLRVERTLNRTALESASTRVCQAKSAVSGDLSSLPAFLQSQAQNLFGLSDLQFKTLLRGKFMPDPRLRINQVILRNLNQSLQAIDPSLRRFSENVNSFGLNLAALSNMNIADLFASLVEILLRQVRAVRAQLEAVGAGYTADAASLAKLPGATGTKSYKDAVKSGTTPTNADLAGATPSNDSIVGSVTNALEVQASAYLQLVMLCALTSQVSAAYPAINGLLKANNQLSRLLTKLAANFAFDRCPANAADTLNTTMKALDVEIEKRLRGTVADNEPMLKAFERVDAAITSQGQWLTCLEAQTKEVLNVFGLGQFADIAKQAMAIAALAGRSAALAELLATFNYKDAFNTTKNPFDAVLEALQCLLQCDSPNIRGLVSEIEPSFKLLALGANANHLTLHVLDSLQQAQTSVGNNRQTQLFMRLMRLMQSLTSLRPEDICAIGKTPVDCGTPGQSRSSGVAPGSASSRVEPAGGFRGPGIPKKLVTDTVQQRVPLGG